MIWKKNATLEQLNSANKHTMMEAIGIVYTEIGEDYITAKMPVDKRTHNPVGLLHGGASASLSETLGSIASYLIEDASTPVGLEINANHMRSETAGYVYGTVRPIKLGKTIHVWETKITNEKNELVCISRLTVFIKK